MKETFKNLKRVYNYGHEFKKNLIIFTIMSLSFVAINIIIPIFSAKQLVYLSGGLFKEVIYASLIVLLIEFVSALNHVILRKNTQKFFRGTTKNIQLKTMNEIVKIKIKDLETKSSGTFIQRIGNDTLDMSKIFTRGMGFLTNILTDIGIFVAVFLISKKVFLYFAISSSLLTFLHLRKIKKVDIDDRNYRLVKEENGGLIGEVVRGIRDIKMLNAKRSFINETEKTIDKLTQAEFNVRNTDMKYNFLISTANSIITFGLIVLLIMENSLGYLSVAQILVLYNYKDRVLRNLIEHVGNLLEECRDFNLSCYRVFSIIDENEFDKEKFGKNCLKDFSGHIEFKNVSFSYKEDAKVLNKINFEIPSNKKIAFVGKSGAGKSTIMSLLSFLYDNYDGEILLDGVELKELDEYSIRENITAISQTPYIFNMSIRDNLRLVKTDVTENKIVEALKTACLYDFIESLPDGLDTVLGEGGMTLSGGQRQRLAIARALIQDSKVILFDEATSALDNETQKNIQKAIDNIKGKTLIIVAHRLSTIVNSDIIFYLDNGKIIAKGTHEELLKNAKYKKLYNEESKKKTSV